MTPVRRRIAMTIATLSLAGLTTACGALGQAVDCNEVATEVTKISNEFSTSMASVATDPKAFETAGDEAAKKVKDLAAKYDGELAAALNDLAATFDGLSIDPKNPTAAMESTSKLQGFTTKIQSACS
ncbi:hypothetical protein ACWGH8_42895 [Nonomuraea muscovyensis]|uniref:Small secreted protein n=1 Tax=Nonomuraea muscovyensis TaxID=1124761 RepID=A0A7X0CAR1_9ACTN|nr:hypothetical protein [Nonomuraea muscovyensis]MBB6351218.1 hypothetical protein [Nonomuraea muscovyensis]MDF2706124.1 hypothetical protein [Nonomuraea muscovyensis]